MSKGLETRTIVLLIIGLIILGIVFGILFLGTGPFSDAAKFAKCRGQLIAFCQGTAGLSDDCKGKQFGSYKEICNGDVSNCLTNDYLSSSTPPRKCEDYKPYSNLNCCNIFE